MYFTMFSRKQSIHAAESAAMLAAGRHRATMRNRLPPTFALTRGAFARSCATTCHRKTAVSGLTIFGRTPTQAF